MLGSDFFVELINFPFGAFIDLISVRFGLEWEVMAGNDRFDKHCNQQNAQEHSSIATAYSWLSSFHCSYC